jgi:hypothetical protein
MYEFLSSVDSSETIGNVSRIFMSLLLLINYIALTAFAATNSLLRPNHESSR